MLKSSFYRFLAVASFLTQFGDGVTLGNRGGRQPQPSARTMTSNWDEEEVARTTNNMHDVEPDIEPDLEPDRRERANEEE